jgi:hypothetical protein
MALKVLFGACTFQHEIAQVAGELSLRHMANTLSLTT